MRLKGVERTSLGELIELGHLIILLTYRRKLRPHLMQLTKAGPVFAKNRKLVGSIKYGSVV